MKTACINSTLSMAPNGYAIKKVNGRNIMHHRFEYCKHHSIDPATIKHLVVRHACNNRACINPEHLQLGTQKDNMLDKVRDGRQPRGELSSSAKLTLQDVIEIKASTATCKVLAAKFKVSATAISRVRTGQTWAGYAKLVEDEINKK